jgi:tetratricopeptide (TPR) repeat protein
MKISKSIYLLAIFSLITLLGCTSATSYTCKDLSEHYYQFLDEIKHGDDPNFLITKLQKILDKRPSCTYAHLLSGEVYSIINKNDSAIIYFLNALELNPVSVYALYKLGILYNAEKKYDSAIIFYRKAASLKTDNGMVFEYTKEFNELTNTASFDIPYNDIIYNNAIASFNIGNLSDALNEINYSINHNTNVMEATFIRGMIYLGMNENAKACDDFFASKMRGVPEAQQYIDKNCKGK